MKPTMRFTRKLIRVEQVDFGARGEESTEGRTQELREADKFRYFAPEGQVPPDPRSEMDELYSKDKNVPQIDLEAFGNAYISKIEEAQFKLDMAALQREVDLLEED